jgi:RecA/RadA recombinase
MHFLTLWPSLRATSGTYAEVTWGDLRAFASSPLVQPLRESLPGWSAARFRGDQRGLAHLDAVSLVVLDVDVGGKTLDDLRAAFAGVLGLVHSSHSHDPARGVRKWRVVLATTRAVRPDEYVRVWGVVAEGAAARGVELDQATKDGSRFWFQPAKRSPEAPYEWAELEGEPIDVDAVLAAAPPARAAKVPLDLRRAPEHDVDPAAHALGRAWPASGRHQAQLALAGALRAEGWAAERALDFLCAVCRVAGDEDRPKREATVRHTYSRPADAPTTGWTRLREHVPALVVDAVRRAVSSDAAIGARVDDVRARLATIDTERRLVQPSSDVLYQQGQAPEHARMTAAQRAMRFVGRDATRLTTGLPTLDAATRGGISARKLVVVGGAPGAGKTALLVKLAFYWLSKGVAVGILASDEDADGLLTRLGQLSGIPRDALECGAPAACRQLSDWCSRVPLLLVDGDEDGSSVESLSAELRVLAAGRPSGMLVDSIQTARTVAQVPSGTDARARVDAVVRALKCASKVDGHVVVASSELARAAYRSRDAAEQTNALAAFKESGAIEYGVSLAVVLSSRQGTSEIVDAAVVKNRLGPGKPEFVLRLDHDRADVQETSMEAGLAADPLMLVKLAIKAVVAQAHGTPLSKSQIADKVGGRVQSAWRAIGELLDAHELHQEKRGIRLPLPMEPGYAERTLPMTQQSPLPAPLEGGGRTGPFPTLPSLGRLREGVGNLPGNPSRSLPEEDPREDVAPRQTE